jgi:hypothetical protein
MINAINNMRYDPDTEELFCNPEDIEEDEVRGGSIPPAYV